MQCCNYSVITVYGTCNVIYHVDCFCTVIIILLSLSSVLSYYSSWKDRNSKIKGDGNVREESRCLVLPKTQPDP